MAADQVAAEPVRIAQGLFKIDLSLSVQADSAGQRFLRDMCFEIIGTQADSSQADATDCNAVPDGNIRHVQRVAGNDEFGISVNRGDSTDLANGLYDSCKHGVILAGNPDKLRMSVDLMKQLLNTMSHTSYRGLNDSTKQKNMMNKKNRYLSQLDWRLCVNTLAALLAALLCAFEAQAGDAADSTAPYQQRPEVQAFIAEMTKRHGFSADELQVVFADVEFQSSVIKAMEPAASPGVRSWERYKSRFVNQRRINLGVKFMQEYAAELKRARQIYGVPEEIIAAIIGVETIYGQNTGKYRVIDALTTLAFDYPRRAEYFRGELEQYLLMAREQQLEYGAVLGSYAGAIGLPQFMPTNVRQLAVDFDGDGRIDLRNSEVDAIGSVARYLSVHGWLSGAPVASHVAFDAAVPDAWVETILPEMTREDIRHIGFNTREPLDKSLSFAVIPLETPEKPAEFWLGFNNFYVITRYNKSTFYAMSVLQLAEALAGQR